MVHLLISQVRRAHRSFSSLVPTRNTNIHQHVQTLLVVQLPLGLELFGRERSELVCVTNPKLGPLCHLPGGCFLDGHRQGKGRQLPCLSLKNRLQNGCRMLKNHFVTTRAGI